MKAREVKKIVKEKYAKIAKDNSGCRCSCEPSCYDSTTLGYSDEELKEFSEANLGLGCGNPVAFSKIKEGDVVLDLGSGAGIDCFLAAKKVGSRGRIIGVDMTEEMIEKARKNAEKHDYKNIEFRLGDIENLPIKDNSIDVIISNCVINLSPDKSKVFREAYRVLKEGGRMYISDIVLLKELTKEQKNDYELLVGCVGGALLKHDYINKIKGAGFEVEVLSEDKEISERQYQGIALESLLIEARK